MNKFIFALDLDGTLAQDNALLSVQTIHQLQQWAKQGVCIVITTGRTWLNAKDIYEVCQLSTPIILYNGAYVYLPKENKVLQSFTLEKEYIHYLLLNEEFASLLAFVVCEYQNQHFEVNLTQNTTQSFIEKLTINPTSFVIQLVMICLWMVNGWFIGLQINTAITIVTQNKSSLMISLNSSGIQLGQVLGTSIAAMIIIKAIYHLLFYYQR